MKKISLTILVVLALFSINLAQDETLLSGKIDNGGFGGPVVKFTQINNEFGVLVGGRGGWIINHTFVIGGGGYGLVSKIEGNELFNNEIPYINFGYGGVELEYIHNSSKLIHYSVYTLIGSGAVSYRNRTEEDIHRDWNDNKGDVFFIVEPSVNVELNIVDFFRINIGAGYRFISGIDSRSLTNSDFSGPSGQITLKFGSF